MDRLVPDSHAAQIGGRRAASPSMFSRAVDSLEKNECDGNNPDRIVPQYAAIPPCMIRRLIDRNSAKTKAKPKIGLLIRPMKTMANNTYTIGPSHVGIPIIDWTKAGFAST